MTNHNFFEKSSRTRLVLPNKVTVMNHPDHDDSYTGSATDAASYAAMGDQYYTKTIYLRPSSNAQCVLIATGVLLKYQLAAEKGHGNVPMNCGQEYCDYVKFTDSWASDTRVGNVGYLYRWYSVYEKQPTRFGMELRFGTMEMAGLAGTLPPRAITTTHVYEGLEGYQVLRETTADLIDQYNSLWDYVERILDNQTKIVDYLLLIDTGQLAPGAVTVAKTARGNQPYTAEIEFTATAYNAISWTAGAVKFGDGRIQEVAAGTLTLTGTHYLYCTYGSSTLSDAGEEYPYAYPFMYGEYSNAVGNTKVLVGIASIGSTVAQKAYVTNPFNASILINTDKVMDGLVTELKLADAAVAEAKIAASAVTGGKIAALSIVGGHIQSLQIDSVHINAGAVIAEKIASSAITTIKLDALAVTAAKIAAGTITADKLSFTAYVIGTNDLDDIADGVYGKVLTTQISAGNLNLTSATVKSGEWYSASGVDIDATSGINIYGTANALTTRATKTGTIQCYVGADGKIYAGAGAVALDVDGITLKGQELKFQHTDGTTKGWIWGIAGALNLHTNAEDLSLRALGAGKVARLWGAGGTVVQSSVDEGVTIRAGQDTAADPPVADAIELTAQKHIALLPGAGETARVTRMATTIATTLITAGTNYQNTTGKLLFVTISVLLYLGESASLRIGAASPAATEVAYVQAGSADEICFNMCALVPADYYWKVVSAGTVQKSVTETIG